MPKPTSLMLNFHTRRLVQLKNQLKAVEHGEIVEQIREDVVYERRRLEWLKGRMLELITGDEELKGLYESYLQVKGVGWRSAVALIVRMPELGRINRCQAASLLGVAPFDRSSGGTIRRARIKEGRKSLRQVLYVATISSLRCNEVMRARYDRLIKAGKRVKVALIACMRMLIIHLNGIAREYYKGRPASMQSDPV